LHSLSPPPKKKGKKMTTVKLVGKFHPTHGLQAHANRVVGFSIGWKNLLSFDTKTGEFESTKLTEESSVAKGERGVCFGRPMCVANVKKRLHIIDCLTEGSAVPLRPAPLPHSLFKFDSSRLYVLSRPTHPRTVVDAYGEVHYVKTVDEFPEGNNKNNNKKQGHQPEVSVYGMDGKQLKSIRLQYPENVIDWKVRYLFPRERVGLIMVVTNEWQVMSFNLEGKLVAMIGNLERDSDLQNMWPCSGLPQVDRNGFIYRIKPAKKKCMVHRHNGDFVTSFDLPKTLTLLSDSDSDAVFGYSSDCRVFRLPSIE
jgi:hypothetical protein